MRVFGVLLITTLLFCTKCEAETTAKELAKQYKSASTPYSRLLVCTEAINEGIIAPGKDADVIFEIFGHDVAGPRIGKAEPGKLESNFVFFDLEKIRRESKPNSTAALSGWFFYCYYDEARKIKKYFITNSPFKAGFES